MTEDQNPVPKGSRSFRASVDDSVSRRDQEMWKRARLFIRNITSRYVNASSQVEPILQRDIRNLWYLFIGAARITPTDEAAADRLAVQVLVAREIGPLKTISEDAEDNIPLSAAHHSPRIWTELPYLGTDLRAAWVQAVETRNTLPSDQLANLAGFTGRLVAFGICEAELSQCCLLLLRAALETPRRVLDSKDTVEASDMPFTYFMPALLAWFRHGSYKLFCLCARGVTSKLEINTTTQAEDRWVVGGSLLSASSPGSNRNWLDSPWSDGDFGSKGWTRLPSRTWLPRKKNWRKRQDIVTDFWILGRISPEVTTTIVHSQGRCTLIWIDRLACHKSYVVSSSNIHFAAVCVKFVCP
jgi:hypothetical protein